MACSSRETDAQFVNGSNVISTYTRIMNSRSVYVASHYFSNNVVLDWFGRTIAGKDNVLYFLFEDVCLSNHDIIQVKNQEEDMQIMHSLQRTVDRFRQPLLCEKEDSFDFNDSGIWDSSFSSTGSLTPRSHMASDLSRLCLSKDNEDGLILNPVSSTFRTPIGTKIPKAPGPLKRATTSTVLRSLKQVDVPKNLQLVDAAGCLTFSPEEDQCNAGKPYIKHCHLKIGYCPQPSLEHPILFSFLLYNEDMPCRRNLSRIFDQCK